MTAQPLARPAATVWTPDRPNDCACGYQVHYRGRFLVKEPAEAWAMLEKVHSDPQRRTLTERMRQVCRKDYGLGFQHLGDSRKSYSGYPDLHLWPVDAIPGVRPVHVWIEMKRMGENPTAEQVAVLTSFARMDPVYLVRPCCLLCGAVDTLLVRHYGGKPRSRYADGGDDWPWEPPLDAAPTKGAAKAAAHRPAGSRPRPARPVEQPGYDVPGLELGQLHGYVVPMPIDTEAAAVFHQLERWLADCGFPPSSVPIPMRFIVGRTYLGVQVSTGTAKAGVPAPRVWRYGSPRAAFPRELLDRLGAVGVPGSGQDLERRIEAMGA